MMMMMKMVAVTECVYLTVDVTMSDDFDENYDDENGDDCVGYVVNDWSSHVNRPMMRTIRNNVSDSSIDVQLVTMVAMMWMNVMNSTNWMTTMIRPMQPAMLS